MGESGGMLKSDVLTIRERIEANNRYMRISADKWNVYDLKLWGFGFSKKHDVWRTYCKIVGRDPSAQGDKSK